MSRVMKRAPGGGDGAVKNAFSHRQAGSVSCDITREVQPVSENGDADAMRFGLVGSDAGNKLQVGDCASGRDCELGYEKYRVCTCRHYSANTLVEPAKVVCQACLPDVLVGATLQVGIF